MISKLQKVVLSMVGLFALAGCGASSLASSPATETAVPLQIPLSPPAVPEPVAAVPSPNTPPRSTPAPRSAAPVAAKAPAQAPPRAPEASKAPAPGVEYPAASQACESNTETVSSLGAMATDCETARRVSAGYSATVMADGEFPDGQPVQVEDGWSCRVTGSSGDGGEVFGLNCSKAGASVTFEWGV